MKTPIDSHACQGGIQRQSKDLNMQSSRCLKTALVGLLLAALPGWGQPPASPSGRFVQFSKAAKGSDGSVRIAAACFVPGAEAERVVSAGFLADGSVLAAVDRGEHSQLLRFAPDLREANPVQLTLPGPIRNVLPGPQPVLVCGDMADSTALLNAMQIENPEAVQRSLERNRAPGNDSALIRIDAEGTPQWALRFKHRSIDAHRLGDSDLLVESGRKTWIVRASDGNLRDGPAIPDYLRYRVRTPLVTDARDGSIAFGGEIHSGTGLEPWRSPLMYKLDREGKVIWTAWNWTGPVVGTDRFRLVSDSAVRLLRLGSGGDLIVGGWSDGGNSVFFRQPYDLTQTRPHSKFGDSVWGAGVLSVAHIMCIDPDTMELKGGTAWLSYNAYVNTPNSSRLSDLHQLPDGRVLITGGSSSGLIETPDAWVKAWSAGGSVKGGSFFSIFSSDFSELLFSSVVPGLKDGRLAVHGNRVLLYGAASARETAYGMNEPVRIAGAPKGFDRYGGGETDGYLMLIDTGEAP